MNSSLSTVTKNDFYCYYEVKLITKHFMQKIKQQQLVQGLAVFRELIFSFESWTNC